MQLELTNISQNFLKAIQQDKPKIKLFKYRHFLNKFYQKAIPLFDQMTIYALDKKLLGQYELLYENAKKEIHKSQLYKQQRQQMIFTSNQMRQQTEHAESVSSYNDMITGYYKLANYYRSVGIHKQATSYYSKLFRAQYGSKIIYSRSQYFSQWAQEIYLNGNWTELSIFLRNDIEDPKLADASLCLIKDIRSTHFSKESTKFFQNLLNSNWLNISLIASNQIMSHMDLGFIYSLSALAYQNRETLRRKVPWSSNLEVLYLQNKFIRLFQTTQRIYQTQGQFHPLIDQIYNKFMLKIRQRVLIKFLSAYHSVNFQKIYQQTSFSEGQIRKTLLSNLQLPYLIDPITQSVVYHEKSIPLYEETLKYSQNIKSKFKNLIKSCINSKRSQSQAGDSPGGKKNILNGKDIDLE